MGLVCSAADGEGAPPGVLFGEPVGILRPVTHRLLERFTVQPFGVLGISDLGPQAGTPVIPQGAAIDAIIVDATKTQEMLDNTPFAAKGVSQSIYTWLGMYTRSGRYPDEVWNHFEQAGRSCERMAKYHRYSEGQHVIHAVGPHLRKLDQSIRDLIDTYASILWEFCVAIGPDPEETDDAEESDNDRLFKKNGNGTHAKLDTPCKPSPPRRLRLLPISSDGGVLTKELMPQMGRVFWSSVAMALERLPAVLQRRLQSAVVEVCIYRHQQVKMFEDALREKWDGGGLRVPSDWGQLRMYDGTYDWIRMRNTSRDRFLRLHAAATTMRSIWEEGYVLPDGRGVGLNHVQRMIAGTRIWNRVRENLDESQKRLGAPGPKVQACVDESATVIELATALARKDKKVSAVFVSSPHRPGNEILSGDCHGSEEEWCMTTTVLKSLQHAQLLRKDEEHRSGGDCFEYGCVVSPFVEVFRDCAEQGYMFMSEPATLHSVVSVMVDPSRSWQPSENNMRRILRTTFSAVAETGAEVLVLPYCSVFDLMDNPISSGTMLGETLLEDVFCGAFDEVVIVGNRTFAQSVACAVRGERPPAGDPQSVSHPMLNSGQRPVPHPIMARTTSTESTTSNAGRKGWSITPRHDSSEFLAKHYTEVREIGSGAFGRVTLVRENATQDERVCKIVSLAGMKADMIAMLKREAELLRGLDHPGVVRLYEYAEDLKLQQIIMILEYVPGGGCDDLLSQSLGVPLSETLVVRIIYQLLVTLAYCHSQGIVHRDLKPENIMLTCRPIWRSPDVKLIDFGAAASHEQLKGEVIGTVEYMAPEICRGDHGGAPADIWAVAVGAFELLLGEPPFGSCDDDVRDSQRKPGMKDAAELVQKRIMAFSGSLEDVQSHSSIPLWHKWQCRNDQFWQRISQEAQDFIRWILNPNPKKRPTARDALEHPWMEMHKPEPCKLTAEMAVSLNAYVKAPRIIQNCMVVVAASLGAADMEGIGPVFLCADHDCDGKLSIKELRQCLANIALPSSENGSGRNLEKPVKDSLLLGDMDLDDGLGFTEFCAACLFTKQPSIDRLIEEAFYALDVDRAGFVLARDALVIFGTDAAVFPEGQSFTLEQWCASVKACANGLPLADAAKTVNAKQSSPAATPTLRIRRRGPRSACC